MPAKIFLIWTNVTRTNVTMTPIMQDLSKYTYPTSFLGMGLPTTVVGIRPAKILSLLGTGFINANPTDKSGRKIVIISQHWSKNVQTWQKSVWKCTKSVLKCPKPVLKCSNQSKDVQNILKVLILPSISYSWQKVRDIPSRSYCWSLNLLSTRCPGAATICSSANSGPLWVGLELRLTLARK